MTTMIAIVSLILLGFAISEAYVTPSKGLRKSSIPSEISSSTHSAFHVPYSYRCLSYSYHSHLSESQNPMHRKAVQRENESENLRGKLRKLTGFSLTAFRTTLRLATGFSLTSTRATLRALTGVSVTGTMKAILRLFPASFRYFLQPLLILYYVPLLTLQGLVGRTKTYKADAKAAHDSIVQDWKDAVRVAEEVNKGGYWPIHVDGM